MSNLVYCSVALFMAAILVGQLVSGRGLGAWRFPGITREADPAAFWLVVAAQGAILIPFLMTGRTWALR